MVFVLEKDHGDLYRTLSNTFKRIILFQPVVVLQQLLTEDDADRHGDGRRSFTKESNQRTSAKSSSGRNSPDLLFMGRLL